VKQPVLILIDFERSVVARYLGRTRTLRCSPDVDARACDWHEALHALRFKPETLLPPEAA
jgi:hypothetical protein